VGPPTCEALTSSSQISESAKTRSQKPRGSRINLPKSDKDSPPKKVSIPTSARSMSGNCFTSTFWAMRSTSASRRPLLSSTLANMMKSTQGTWLQDSLFLRVTNKSGNLSTTQSSQISDLEKRKRNHWRFPFWRRSCLLPFRTYQTPYWI
jgi:hypothetical protein